MLFEKQNNNTVEEYMTKWLVNTKRPSLKRSSYDRVEQSLNYQIFPAIGKIKLKKLTADDIQMMLNDLAERSSYSTTKKAYVNLKSCLDLAVLYFGQFWKVRNVKIRNALRDTFRIPKGIKSYVL